MNEAYDQLWKDWLGKYNLWDLEGLEDIWDCEDIEWHETHSLNDIYLPMGDYMQSHELPYHDDYRDHKENKNNLLLVEKFFILHEALLYMYQFLLMVDHRNRCVW